MESKPHQISEREHIIRNAIRIFIESLPNDECYQVDVKVDKLAKFRSVCIKRTGKSP